MCYNIVLVPKKVTDFLFYFLHFFSIFGKHKGPFTPQVKWRKCKFTPVQ